MGILSVIVWCAVTGFLVYILKKYFNGPKTPLSKSMEGKTVIVTGSNAGIGRETALDLLEKGARVIFACRDEERTFKVIKEMSDKKKAQNAYFIKLDLGSFESINKFAVEFKKSFGTFDVLINNAGALFDAFSRLERIESTIITNHVGPVYLTALLLPMINKEGLIVNVSSLMHTYINAEKFNEYLKEVDFSESEPKYSPINAYSFSKLANILHASALDNYARKNNINFKTASLHPGVVATDFNKKATTWPYKILMFISIPFQYIFSKDCKMGAQTTLHVVYTDYRSLNSGAYFSDCVEVPKSQVASDPQNVKKLMEYTMRLIYNNISQIPKEIETFFTLLNSS
jgi:retinol dehydrogenase-12